MHELAYKITYKHESLSAVDKYSLDYSIGVKTDKVPGTLGLFCFDTIYNVVQFLGECGAQYNYQVYEVKGIDRQYTKESLRIVSVTSEQVINRYYQGDKQGDIKLPIGTVLYNSIIPIRLINKWVYTRGGF
jgi:hypothetical protein